MLKKCKNLGFRLQNLSFVFYFSASQVKIFEFLALKIAKNWVFRSKLFTFSVKHESKTSRQVEKESKLAFSQLKQRENSSLQFKFNAFPLKCFLQLLARDGKQFKELIQQSLRRHIEAINYLSDKGLFFWDYGNAFLLEAQRAGADVSAKDDPTGLKFRYPSYVQDIMG